MITTEANQKAPNFQPPQNYKEGSIHDSCMKCSPWAWRDGGRRHPWTIWFHISKSLCPLYFSIWYIVHMKAYIVIMCRLMYIHARALQTGHSSKEGDLRIYFSQHQAFRPLNQGFQWSLNSFWTTQPAVWTSLETHQAYRGFGLR